MSELVGLDGRPLDDSREVIGVTADEYSQGLGERSGFTADEVEFFKKNMPEMGAEIDGDNLSRSQRQILAMKRALLKLSLDNIQLWTLVAAFTAANGGSAEFTQATLAKYNGPKFWPQVVAESETGTIRLGLPDDGPMSIAPGVGGDAA